MPEPEARIGRMVNDYGGTLPHTAEQSEMFVAAYILVYRTLLSTSNIIGKLKARDEEISVPFIHLERCRARHRHLLSVCRRN